jgi:sugar/nucleoside kinase (ribokinase family)
MTDFDVLGIGHAAYDTFGLLETMPPAGTAAWIETLDHQGGGAAAQAMVAAARLGMKAAFAGMVGDDDEGLYLKKDFEREGVNIDGLYIEKKAVTSKAFVMVERRGGRRTIFVHPGSMSALLFNDDLKKLILRSRMIHLDGTVHDLACNAAVFARQQGIPVSLDGCEIRAGPMAARSLVSTVDILIANEDYARQITGLEDPEEAFRGLKETGPHLIIATQGKNGSWLLDGGEIRKFPAYNVPVVDTTGAGDVFHGAFLAAYLRDMPVPEAIRYASACAAINCASLGGRRGIPTREVLERFIADHDFNM